MKYANDISVYGMLPAHAEFVSGNRMAVFKNKQHKSIISWDESFASTTIPVSYFYLDKKPDPQKFKNISHKSQHLLGVFNEEFFKLKGEKFKRLRKIRNRYSLCAEVKYECDLNETLEVISNWESLHGKHRYRMLMHSSYDKRFFKTSLQQIKDNVKVYYLFIGKKCVGYKVMQKNPYVREDGLLEYVAMLRKYDPSYQHICTYLDLIVYKMMLDENGNKPFVVNSGTSAKGVESYKSEKFPIYAEETVYFCNNGLKVQ